MAWVILKPISDQKVLFTFLLMMTCLVIPVMCYATRAFPKPFVFVFPVFDCYLLTLLAYWLKHIHMHWIIWFVAFLLSGGEVFSLLCYQSPYSMTVIMVILETNGRETAEFLSGYGVPLKLASTFAITLGMILVSHLVVRSCSRLEARSRSFAHYSPFLLLLLISAACQGYSYFRLYQAYTADVTSTLVESKYMPLRNSPFVRFLYGHALNVVSTKDLRKLAHVVERTEVDSCSYRSPIILLLIGESYNKYHSPLYNPESRPTTPNLCRLREQGNLIVYDDAVSPYNVTSKAFRQMFSTYYPGCGREWVDCTLFPAVFRKAGYRVWFITNQFVDEGNNVYSYDHTGGGTIFNQSDLRRLQFTHMNTEETRYDMDLLSQLPPADTLAAQPSLLIFHMIGQHEDYVERYPSVYSHFTADSIRNPYADERGRRIVAEYDNATLYNDAVVGKLFSMYASQDVVGIYLSDHGEEIYDWRNSCYRTNSDQMTPEIARYQYGIPFLFYVSDRFRENHPDLLGEIQAAQHKPFSSTMLPYVLFHLAGISYADCKPSLNILSPDFDKSLPRIIRENVDYDALMQNR